MYKCVCVCVCVSCKFQREDLQDFWISLLELFSGPELLSPASDETKCFADLFFEIKSIYLFSFKPL